MSVSLKLKIADIFTLVQSEFTLKRLPKNPAGIHDSKKWKNFLFKGKSDPDIIIDIKIVSRLPRITGSKDIFVTYHPDCHIENWRLAKKKDGYIYKTAVDRQQLMVVNKEFDRVTAYLPRENEKADTWDLDDIVYDFLQVLMINYLAVRKSGILLHGMGVKDSGDGLLFVGESGAGKSTAARIWYKHSSAMILNDDRIIVRNSNGKFFIYGSPWHGEFDDYLDSAMEPAPLKKLFFIYHSPKNVLTALSAKEAFCALYPVLFAPFWDRKFLDFNIAFCQELVEGVECFRLGFVNNKEVINFVRSS